MLSGQRKRFRNRRPFYLQVHVLLGKHVSEEVNRAVLVASVREKGAAKGQAFAGQDAGPLVAECCTGQT